MNSDSGSHLLDSVRLVLEQKQGVADLLGLSVTSTKSFAELAGDLLASICQNNEQVKSLVTRVYGDSPQLVAMSEHDIAETSRRNFEPGGVASSLLFSRGVHAVMIHRVVHQLWSDGEPELAHALKVVSGRSLSMDIHPAAKIGAGFWLDHGLGFVAGEVVIIEEDVSIWHNVTLGSTFNNSVANRHPKIGTGAIIGAGASVLGNITVGAGANVAAGSIVLNDVPPRTTVVGTKARNIGAARISFI